jgi:excisionase family DNA binding protein
VTGLRARCAPISPAGHGQRDSAVPKAAPHATRKLVSIAEAAAAVEMSTRTIRRYVADGLITGYRIGPRAIRVDLAEIDQLARPIAAAPRRA